MTIEEKAITYKLCYKMLRQHGLKQHHTARSVRDAHPLHRASLFVLYFQCGKTQLLTSEVPKATHNSPTVSKASGVLVRYHAVVAVDYDTQEPRPSGGV